MNALNLRLFQSHSLHDPQRRSASITVQRQRFQSNVSISMDKVHLYGRLVSLQGQQSLPHDRVAFEEIGEGFRWRRYLTGLRRGC